MAPASVNACAEAGSISHTLAPLAAVSSPALDVPVPDAPIHETPILGAPILDAPIFEASEPVEARGLRRDDVRLLVSDVGRDSLRHAHFRDLPDLLAEGDLLVVNTSGTLSAALPADVDGGAGVGAVDVDETDARFALHLSTYLGNDVWVVELRQAGPVASLPYRGARAGLTLRLPADARATLLAPHPPVAARSARADERDCEGRRSDERRPDGHASSSRLWLADVRLRGAAPRASRADDDGVLHHMMQRYVPEAMRRYLDRFGVPIRYGYVPKPWPAAMYQTVFATEPGSAEMPSAARPFTGELVARLVARGIQFAPLLLHTGVASLEDHEPPYAERYRVSAETAARVNAARRAGRRVIAVGTTAVRALETVTDAHGIAHPGEGWTDLVVTPDRALRAVDSIVTGLHEPRATHLAILERVIAGRGARPVPGHLARAYAEARRAGYRWHEFGDAHLILGAPVVKTFTVPAASRRNVAVTGAAGDVPELTNESFGALIESTQPIIVERSSTRTSTA